MEELTCFFKYFYSPENPLDILELTWEFAYELQLKWYLIPLKDLGGGWSCGSRSIGCMCNLPIKKAKKINLWWKSYYLEASIDLELQHQVLFEHIWWIKNFQK